MVGGNAILLIQVNQVASSIIFCRRKGSAIFPVEGTNHAGGVHGDSFVTGIDIVGAAVGGDTILATQICRLLGDMGVYRVTTGLGAHVRAGNHRVHQRFYVGVADSVITEDEVFAATTENDIHTTAAQGDQVAITQILCTINTQGVITGFAGHKDLGLD